MTRNGLEITRNDENSLFNVRFTRNMMNDKMKHMRMLRSFLNSQKP